ncbi:Nn.00g052170.m01.CDS01 [Neocucurbitaria sp. VM-36]
MSFYVYYGKLANELLVAVLPNGTVEHGDPIYLYTKKKFSSYKAKDVSVTDDGEDIVAFNDGYYSYQAVSKKAYKELNLTVKSGEGITSKVVLVRHYDQPLTAIPLSDSPKIWTGAVDFHQWAKNESFIAVAPKGLGNGKPIVALWQWTEDAKGTPRTLSYSTGKQESEAASPTTFSFKQGDYYTLNCKVNAATNGLNITIKSPSNPEVVQKELALSAKVELGAEHRFAPPRAPQHQITLDCSHPRAAPSLPRITGALPFPADLVETLTYSAAYVDQAGYLAKYAVKQFDQLDKSFHQLEKKSEARAAKVSKLEGEVTRLGEANHLLTGQNAGLQKQLEENRVKAVNAQKSLETKLQEALNALAAKERALATSESEKKKLEAYISADKLADIARDRKHHEHEAADHKAIDLANKALKESRESEQRLQETVEEKTEAIAKFKSSLEVSRAQLGDAKATICELKSKLDAETTQNKQLKKDLEAETYLRTAAEEELNDSKTLNVQNNKTIQDKTAEIERQDGTIRQISALLKTVESDFEAKKNELKEYRSQSQASITDLQTRLETARKHDKDHHVPASKTNVTPTVTEIVA